MSFNVEGFIELAKKKKLSNQNIVDIFKEKYGKEITIDTIKSYRRKNGKNAEPSNENLIILSEILNTSVDYLLGVEDEKKPVKIIPITGTTSCGSANINHYQDNDRVCYYNGEFFKDSLYCVIANGDSMSPEIEDGDEIICNPDVEPQNGDIVHYTIGDESAVKVYVKDEDAYIVQFIPYNSNENFKTKTIRLDDDDAQKIKIAKVVAINKLKFNNRAARLRLIGR